MAFGLLRLRVVSLTGGHRLRTLSPVATETGSDATRGPMGPAIAVTIRIDQVQLPAVGLGQGAGNANSRGRVGVDRDLM